ncbi:METTL9, partial [Symbiodinium sp. CCMP2592]
VFALCARSGRRYSRHTLPYSAGLLAPALAEHWVQLEADAATEDFLAFCLERSVATTLLKGALARVLCWCLSKTDVNALLGRGEMFVLSAAQALRLFPERPGGVLLDVGAGTGSCTMELAQLFDHVLTTEVSRPMVARLRRRGLPVLEGSDLSGLEALAAEAKIPLEPGGTFDCIALMNVLDRCLRPRSLLQELRRRITPRGRLLIAVVLPFRPFVEPSSSSSRRRRRRRRSTTITTPVLTLPPKLAEVLLHEARHLPVAARREVATFERCDFRGRRGGASEQGTRAPGLPPRGLRTRAVSLRGGSDSHRVFVGRCGFPSQQRWRSLMQATAIWPSSLFLVGDKEIANWMVLQRTPSELGRGGRAPSLLDPVWAWMGSALSFDCGKSVGKLCFKIQTIDLQLCEFINPRENEALKYGFGFYAEIRPSSAISAEVDEEPRREGSEGLLPQCCPELSSWNATFSGSRDTQAFARRLSPLYGGLGGGTLPDEFAPLVDPFARENTGHQPPGHANRRPALQELMRQHDKRLGVHRPALIERAEGPTCELPAWLNATELTALGSGKGKSSADGSGTKEPEVALKYIFKFNPLQGYLADGAGRCGGWSDWCCVCHAAQWQIACLPEVEKSAVDWFLTEDCCESKMRKDTSSPGYVADATPLRESSVLWRPGVGWIEVPRSMNFSDSYYWTAEYGDEGSCPMVAGPEFWEVPAPASEPDWAELQGSTIPASPWHVAEAAVVVMLVLVAFVKGRRPACAGPEGRYIELIEV